MKKLRFLFVIVLFLLVIYSLWAWFQVGSRPDKIGLHRCNSLEKLEEKGREMNLSIRLQREDIFEAMHRV